MQEYLPSTEGMSGACEEEDGSDDQDKGEIHVFVCHFRQTFCRMLKVMAKSMSERCSMETFHRSKLRMLCCSCQVAKQIGVSHGM